MPCCPSAVVVDPVRRNKYVLGRHSGRKFFVQFTNFLMRPMEVLNQVCELQVFHSDLNALEFEEQGR